MLAKLKKTQYWLMIGMALLVLMTSFSYFSKSLIQKELVGSDQTMMMTDSMRHIFKVSMMTSRAMDSYFMAVHTQDTELYENALDYLSAALGFIEMGYIDSQALRTTAEPLIKEIIQMIETYGLNLTTEQTHEVQQKLKQIYYEVEILEQNIWMAFQKNYVTFQVNEIHLRLVYKYAFFAGLFLLTLIAFLYHRQKKIVKRMIEQDLQLQQLAYYDTVTNTLNRRGIELELEKRIELANATQQPFFVGMVDLDNFKHINDVFGHPTGDALLVELSKRLQSELTPQDALGRLGGDEFLLLFDAKETSVGMLEKCQQIIQKMHPAFYISENEYHITISLGIALYPVDAGVSADLLKNVDIALNTAKQQGKNRFQFFKESMREQLDETYAHEKAIRFALEQNHFSVFLQAQMNGLTGKLFGVELLSRWHHPELGIQTPNTFIPYIENGCCLTPFHHWLLTEVATLQKRWKNTEFANLEISVNLAVQFLMQPNFISQFQDLIRQLDINLCKVKFEITEYSLVESGSTLYEEINLLVKKGYRFYLDDFGTGYSSISYLSDLSIDAIKIDKRFVDEIGQTASKNLLNTLINIGKDLHLNMIAEGVETREQSDYLTALGCVQQQGYYFARPTPLTEFENWARQTNSL